VGSYAHMRVYAPGRLFSSSRPTFSTSTRVALNEHGMPPRLPPERDPSHPSLFYHSVTPTSTTHALSFLGEPLNEAYPQSRTILGWIGEGADSRVGFQENPGFRELLHECIAAALTEPGSDPVIESEAMQRGEGWLNINDTRNVPPLNRVGDPDDIIGAVMVQDGKILASSYEPMPTYRICTSDGPPRLTEGLFNKLQEALRKEYEMENE